MNREEQIEKALKDRFMLLNDISTSWAFRLGAEWADSHPKNNNCQHWNKYPDKKPKTSGPYLIALFDGYVTVDIYSASRKAFYTHYPEAGYDDNDVIAWMAKPQAPSFD